VPGPPRGAPAMGRKSQGEIAVAIGRPAHARTAAWAHDGVMAFPFQTVLAIHVGGERSPSWSFGSRSSRRNSGPNPSPRRMGLTSAPRRRSHVRVKLSHGAPSIPHPRSRDRPDATTSCAGSSDTRVSRKDRKL
jgi:hypothetical protein